MESEVARRRVGMISGHFANDDVISPTLLLPMNCSGSLNSVIRRCDNRMYFARQASASHGCFMRPVSSEPGTATRCGAPFESYGTAVSEAPMFSRPKILGPNFSNMAAIQSVGQNCKLKMSEAPKFSRPSKCPTEDMQSYYKRKIYSPKPCGAAWSPKMDIAESGCSYVMMVEIPGVRIGDIRVEVDDQNLMVTGQRATQCWKAADCPSDLISAFHRREITQGPYRVVWPLPSNVNKDRVSAEFLDGFLRIIIPKL